MESVTSAQRSAPYLAAPHPRHEQQSRDHRIDPSALEGDLVRLDTAPASPRPVAGGEHGRQVRDPERPRLSSSPISGSSPVAGEHSGRPLAGGSGLPGQLRAEAHCGDRHRGARRSAPSVVELGDVGRKTRIVELPPVEPGVEPPERAGVGPPGVRADGGLDQPARGRRHAADRGLFGVDPGGPIIHVNGNYR